MTGNLDVYKRQAVGDKITSGGHGRRDELFFNQFFISSDDGDVYKRQLTWFAMQAHGLPILGVK